MRLYDYKQYYESVSFPCVHFFKFGHKYPEWRDGKRTGRYRRVWRFDLWGAMFDPFNGVFRRIAWDDCTYPSYWTGFVNLWNNVVQFCTPWYRNKRRLIQNLVNPNGSKLLAHDRRSAAMRTRDAEPTYVYVECGWIFAKMTAVRYVNAKGEAENLFMRGVSAMCGEEPECLKEEKRTAVWGPVLTRRQCQEFFDRAVAALPELGWFDPDEG